MHNACTYSIHGPHCTICPTLATTHHVSHPYVATTLLFHTPSNNSVVPHPWLQPLVASNPWQPTLLSHTPGNNSYCAYHRPSNDYCTICLTTDAGFWWHPHSYRVHQGKVLRDCPIKLTLENRCIVIDVCHSNNDWS